MTTRALFLCDGTQETGFGHVSRSLGLAEAMAEQGASVSFAGEYASGAAAMLDTAGVDWRQLVGSPEARWHDAIAAARDCDVAIVDSYELSGDMLKTLDSAATTVCIDDYARLERYECDGIVNFTVGAPQLPYTTNAKRWLGPTYLLVRRSLRRARPKSLARSRWPVRRFLVVMGGVDRHRLTMNLVEGIRRSLPDAAVRAAIPAGHPDETALAARLQDAPSGSDLVVQCPDLADQLAWCDASVSGGGLTKYEAAFMGVLPAIVSQSEAEATESEVFQAAGLGVVAGMAGPAEDGQLVAAVVRACEDEGEVTQVAQISPEVFGGDPTATTAKAILDLVNPLRRTVR